MYVISFLPIYCVWTVPPQRSMHKTKQDVPTGISLRLKQYVCARMKVTISPIRDTHPTAVRRTSADRIARRGGGVFPRLTS